MCQCNGTRPRKTLDTQAASYSSSASYTIVDILNVGPYGSFNDRYQQTQKLMIDDTKRLFWMLMVHLIRLTTGANSIVHEYMHESIYRIHEREHKA